MNQQENQKEIHSFLKGLKLLSGCNDSTIEMIKEKAKIQEVIQGQTILRANTIETHCFIVLEGSIRLLAYDKQEDELFTIGIAGKEDIIGMVNLLRQDYCEIAVAKTNSRLVTIPVATLINLYNTDIFFAKKLDELDSISEKSRVLQQIMNTMNPPPANEQEWTIKYIKESKNNEVEVLSSCIKHHEKLVGTCLSEEQRKELKKTSKFNLRFVYVNSTIVNKVQTSPNHDLEDKKEWWNPERSTSMKELGIIDETTIDEKQQFKLIKGKGIVGKNLATLKMIARAYQTPCPVDVLERVLESSNERSKSIPLQVMGQLIESMGLQTQIGEVNISQIYKLELPVAIKRKSHFSLITDIQKQNILLADPESGFEKVNVKELILREKQNIEVILIKKLSDTPTKQFGWSWFTPVIKKFQWPLIQVVLASLFIQLFQLANPLLLQQIIDKVINQSNLTALQVLGSAMVLAALLQGLLTAVRTWLLIDTTDRMDLLLGTQVIDKLLRLPLRFFEKRQVGELSQRLSELGNLRGFLTGTAITSALDLLFASIYILIMILYSPILTAVALGTIPIYVTMIIFVAPLFRKLIRKQAVYAAKTQSHLIETLSGIQTVKAQHIELNSRWKWQEKYSGQISEGFKSVVLSSSANEIGNFLNQFSSLLIIWVGIYQVIGGEMSLGQLIAFRIIAGYVTGPILRLSGLWQGFQQVEISMERLSDIVDQVPETSQNDGDQISLPTIKGDIKFENVKFRFGKQGNYQINNINLRIKSGQFIGIVGQSGSGKSTLVKLLPRLYNPNSGRIFIDDYDISKVSLTSIRQQIGIVPQDCLLFEGTIKENITMNNPEASPEEIVMVAKASAAHEFIMELEEGYSTRIGERGSGLSGGQQQRIAIARTLLQNPKLLILDEATSALDYDTEANISKNLQKMLKGKTVLYITHRLSTVRHADNIILMDKGKISEVGTHNNLIELGGRYKALYDHQSD